MVEKRYRIGVDLGGTNIKVGVVDGKNQIVGKKSARTDAHRPFEAVVGTIAATVNALLGELSIELGECEKLGVGSPGMVDHVNGVVVFSGNLNWDEAPLVTALGAHFQLPMRLSNDANCAVLGEVIAGAAQGCRDVVMITLGTGVGSGVVAGGVLQEGGSAGGMELGHTTIVVDGELCTCGHKGCYEAYASATGLVREARRAARKNPASRLNLVCGDDLGRMNGAIPFKAAQDGDEVAQQVVDSYIKYVGEGIINSINIWRPEKVLLGGGISNEGEPLLAPLNEYVRPRCFAGNKGFVAPIVQAKLGNDAGLLGAAAL